MHLVNTSVRETVPEKVLLTAEEVQRITGFGLGRIYEMMADGSLPSVQIGKRRRVHWPTFSRWLEEQATANFDGDRLRSHMNIA